MWAKVVSSDKLQDKYTLFTPCDDDGNLILTMENHNFHPVTISGGEMLGEVEETMIIQPCSQNLVQDVTVCNIAKTTDGTVQQDSSRTSKLLTLLDIETSLDEEQREVLQTLVHQFSDMFALSSNKLGHTDLTKHIIDTGNHPPISSHPSPQGPLLCYANILKT